MMMMSAHHPGHVFSPHTFVHTTESRPVQQHQAMLAEDEAAAALCALPSTTNHTDLKAFQHIWAQIKDCSDRLHDLTTIATVTSTAAPEAAPPTPALFPLLQQLLSLFHTFNSAVQPTPENASTASGQKRKLERQEDSDVAETAGMLVVKHEHAEESEPHDSQKRQKRARRTKAKPEMANLRCLHCGETDTPEWRRGPAGPKTLCNACGLQYAKFLREADKREKCRLPLSLVLNS